MDRRQVPPMSFKIDVKETLASDRGRAKSSRFFGRFHSFRARWGRSVCQGFTSSDLNRSRSHRCGCTLCTVFTDRDGLRCPWLTVSVLFVRMKYFPFWYPLSRALVISRWSQYFCEMPIYMVLRGRARRYSLGSYAHGVQRSSCSSGTAMGINGIRKWSHGLYGIRFYLPWVSHNRSTLGLRGSD
jgi:hypothetical protein